MADEFKKMMTAGEMATKPETVELPLNPEYITPEGMYVAGYWWGSKGRSPESIPPDAAPEFIQGANDGWGDIKDSWGKKSDPNPVNSFDPTKQDLTTYSDMLSDLRFNGILSEGKYQELVMDAVDKQLGEIIKGLENA